MMRTLSLALMLAAPAAAETRYICWVGGNGYTMTGEFTFPDSLTNSPLVTHDDLTDFRITGNLRGNPIGSWDMSQRTPDTRWLFRYNAQIDKFLFGDLDNGLYQEWNAGGDVDDCGIPGFGFNAGNYAQDVCIDNVWIEDSSVDPLKPLLGFPNPRSPANCDPMIATSKRAE